MAPSSSWEAADPARSPLKVDATSDQGSFRPDSEWLSLQVQAMTDAWARGEPINADDILQQFPGLNTEQSVRLVYEEICLRREAGEQLGTTEVLARFPRWKNELELLLSCDRLLWPLARPPEFPEIGERLGPFRLLAELGRGASGRTYLAAEFALADRLVVLKVMPDDQEEHLSLARLQHTHIIPLFSEQTFADRGLRALCMPYLGGSSLARLLEALAYLPVEQRRGKHLLEALSRVKPGHLHLPASEEGPYRRFLEQASYVQAVCWIVACLADALHEAHAHGLVHMDVKPSNVLIAADGLPLLLDFHLARKPIKLGERVVDRLGGTPGWMAPEQAAALRAVSQGQPVPEPVGTRADLYPLGLLLCEALGGLSGAKLDLKATDLRHYNSHVSAGLADIVQKCLAGRPADRYVDAATLADDLRRHMNDLPLRGVANRSYTERWRKWRRRRPSALARGTAWLFTLAALGVAATSAFAFHHQRVREVETDLEDGRKLSLEHRFPEAIRVLSRGSERASDILAPRSVSEPLAKELRKARLGQKAVELHDFVERYRFRYGSAPPGAQMAQRLVERISTFWAKRGLLLNPEGLALDADLQRNVGADLLELVMVWADLQVRLAADGQRDKALREACRLLDQAEASYGSTPALKRERQVYASALGGGRSPDEPVSPPRSAWEHYDLGRSYLRSKLVARAADEFQRALELQPQDFWSNFYQGLCAYDLGHFDDAVAAFRTCIALSPKCAECYYNRGRAEQALNRPQQALRDYGHALELDLTLAVAFLNRGSLLYDLGRTDEAIADFHRALEARSDRETLGRAHYCLAVSLMNMGEYTSAQENAQEALANGFPRTADLDKILHRER